MLNLPILSLFTHPNTPPTLKLAEFERFNIKTEWGEYIQDRFGEAICLFIRIDKAATISLSSDEPISFSSFSQGGFWGQQNLSTSVNYWVPCNPMIRMINDTNQILAEEIAIPTGWKAADPNGLCIQFETNETECLDLVIWKLPEKIIEFELTQSSSFEREGYFLWGSHARIEKAGELYKHLIFGAIFDLRFSWPHNKKCFSENEAHALYTVFSGLEKATGKVFYRFLQLQIVLSVMQRQAEDGGWYHGMWTDSSECHYRLHTSAVHLLMDEYQREACPTVKESLQKGIAFLSKTTDTLDCGLWFLHDSLELSEETMNSGPFKWIPNRTLGKSISNMLVLNTHLDTTIGINRYGQLTGDKQYQARVDSALQSTRAVLEMQPANWLYKPLFWVIGLTMLPTEKAEKLPAHVRAIKRIAWKYLIKWLPDIKARFPRLVMPNGYIDRELSLRTWAIDYQTINLMDLARYARAFPGQFDESILDKALEFTQSSGLIKRYRELQPGKRYAPGFWMEALYHRCLAKPDIKYRQWLAEAMLECHETGLGMAPSLLGGNGEAVSYSATPPCPIMANQEILVANLSRPQHVEFLFVNTADTEIPFKWLSSSDLQWFKDELPLPMKPEILDPKVRIIGRKIHSNA